jgi:alkaline phosphatase D
MAIIDHVPNVIFLSGDRHEFAAVQLRGKVYEFSTSPLSQYVPDFFPPLCAQS